MSSQGAIWTTLGDMAPAALRPHPGPEPLGVVQPSIERLDGAVIWERLPPEKQAALPVHAALH